MFSSAHLMYDSQHSNVDTVDSFGLFTVIVHASQPYISTDSTIARKRLTFNSWISLDHHTFSIWLSAFYAIALGTLKSVSEAFIHDRRYLKSPTFLSSTLPMVFSGSSGMLKVKYSALCTFCLHSTQWLLCLYHSIRY